jgi:hypothetical protein
MAMSKKQVKVKIFNGYDEQLLNRFLEQTDGVIKHYNPIVVEYTEGEYVDPYEDKDVYVLPRISYYVDRYGDYVKYDKRIYFNQIAISKLDNTITLLDTNDPVIKFDAYSIPYLHLSIGCTGEDLNIEFGKGQSVDFHYYEHIDFPAMLPTVGAKKLS